jgi:hypothetical protein
MSADNLLLKQAMILSLCKTMGNAMEETSPITKNSVWKKIGESALLAVESKATRFINLPENLNYLDNSIILSYLI